MQQPESQIRRAQAYFDEFENTRAEEILSRLDTRTLDDPRVQLLLGELAFEANEQIRAADHLRKARELGSKNPRVTQLLRLVEARNDSTATHAKQSPVEPGRETLTRALTHVALGVVLFASLFALYVWNVKRTEGAATRARGGVQLLEVESRSSLEAAATQFSKALALQPGNAFAAGALAETHARLWVEFGVEESRPRAQALIQRAREQDFRTPERYIAETLIAYGEGDRAQLEDLLAPLEERAHFSHTGRYALGLAQLSLGFERAAIKNFEYALERSGKRAAYACAIGDALAAQGNRQKAATFWQRLDALNPRYGPCEGRLLVGQLWRDGVSEALRLRFAELERTPVSSPAAGRARVYARAQLDLASGEFERAVATLTRGMSLLGETPMLLAARGRARLLRGEVESGLADLLAASVLPRAQPSYLYWWARLAIDYGFADQAIERFEPLEATTVRDVQLMRAEILLRAGRIEEARPIVRALSALSYRKVENAYLQGLLASKTGDSDPNPSLKLASRYGDRIPEALETLATLAISRGAAAEGRERLSEAESAYRKIRKDLVVLELFNQAAQRQMPNRAP